MIKIFIFSIIVLENIRILCILTYNILIFTEKNHVTTLHEINEMKLLIKTYVNHLIGLFQINT